VVRDPQVADLAAAIQPATHHPGLHRFFQGATWLWAGIFPLLTAGLAVMVTAPAKMFLMLSTAATVALVAAGTARPHCGSSRCCAGSG
jgi:hypothetical protein